MVGYWSLQGMASWSRSPQSPSSAEQRKAESEAAMGLFECNGKWYQWTLLFFCKCAATTNKIIPIASWCLSDFSVCLRFGHHHSLSWLWALADRSRIQCGHLHTAQSKKRRLLSQLIFRLIGVPDADVALHPQATSCDVPLSKWLIAMGSLHSSLVLCIAIFLIWSDDAVSMIPPSVSVADCFCYRIKCSPKPSFKRQNKRQCFPTVLQVIIFTELIVLVPAIILGDYWYFRSKNCDDTSKNDVPVSAGLLLYVHRVCEWFAHCFFCCCWDQPPTKMMLPLYQASGIIIFFSNVALFFTPLLCWCGWVS